MWDLPGPGLEPVSPASAGGFLTTRHQGSPELQLLSLIKYYSLLNFILFNVNSTLKSAEQCLFYCFHLPSICLFIFLFFSLSEFFFKCFSYIKIIVGSFLAKLKIIFLFRDDLSLLTFLDVTDSIKSCYLKIFRLGKTLMII